MTTVFIIACAAVLLLIAWLIGRIHISLVDPKEVGRLTPARFKQRLVVYGAPLGTLFAVLRAFDTDISHLRQSTRLFLIGLVAVAGTFALVILYVSYLEAFWYRSGIVSKAARRRRAFEAICIPILYGSLGLYWFALLPAWFLVIRAKTL